jgi:hypothetical protein
MIRNSSQQKASTMADKKEWTDEEVRAEIAAAVKIVAEDRERAQYKSLHERFGEKAAPPEGEKTPPKKETPEGESGKAPEKTKRIFWGNPSADD